MFFPVESLNYKGSEWSKITIAIESGSQNITLKLTFSSKINKQHQISLKQHHWIWKVNMPILSAYNKSRTTRTKSRFFHISTSTLVTRLEMKMWRQFRSFLFYSLSASLSPPFNWHLLKLTTTTLFGWGMQLVHQRRWLAAACWFANRPGMRGWGLKCKRFYATSIQKTRKDKRQLTDK